MKPPTERQLKQARHAARYLWRSATLIKKKPLTPYELIMVRRAVIAAR